MTLPIYQYTLQVEKNEVTPHGPLPCGTDGDHLAARLIFAFTASVMHPDAYRYRLEIVCGNGAYDLTEPQEVEAGEVGWDIPASWTAAGLASVRLVQLEVAADGTETRCRHFPPVLLQFDHRPQGNGTPDVTPRWQALLTRSEQLLNEMSAAHSELVAASRTATAAATAAQVAGEAAEQAATDAAVSAAHSAENAASAVNQVEPFALRAEEAAASADEDAEACDALLLRCEELCGTAEDIAALAGDDGGIEHPCVTVDTALDSHSQNPVANAAVAAALAGTASLSHSHSTGHVTCDNTGYWWGTSGTVEDALMSISGDLASLHSGQWSSSAANITTNQQGGTVEDSLAGLWATKVSASSLSADTVPFAYSGAPSVSTVADALKLLFGKVGM